MKSRTNMPRYASQDPHGIWLTSGQLRACLLGRKHPALSNETVLVTKLKDGTTWAEARGSGAIFWMSRWYALPKIAYERAAVINECVKNVDSIGG